jgi:hypothetical protein
MSMYAMTMQQGIQAGALALGVESAETTAAYNAAYGNLANKLSAARARSAGERNIAAVNQDKVLSNTKIRQQQDEAEAAARVSAALSGASGASVNATIGQTETNESMALAASKKARDQQIEHLKAGVFDATTVLNSKHRQQKSSVLGNLAKLGASVDYDDLQIGEALTADETDAADAGTLQL